MDRGAVALDIRVDAGRIVAVAIDLRRPRLPALLRGRDADEATRLMPLLLAVCAQAQGAAAAAALAAARGAASATHVHEPVRIEATGEQILAVFTGVAAAHAPAARRAARIPAALRRLLEDTLLGASLEEWLALPDAQALTAWADRCDAPLPRECRRRLDQAEPAAAPAALLPVMAAAEGQAVWPTLSHEFAARPLHLGRPAETGAVARMARQPLIAALGARPLLQRWSARLTEIVSFAAAEPAGVCGRVSAVALPEGRGRAAVETARGTLLHEIRLTGGRIAEYVVAAPTEWNFHPRGVLRDWLEGAPCATPEQALDLAQRAAQALDPCVECRVEVSPCTRS